MNPYIGLIMESALISVSFFAISRQRFSTVERILIFLSIYFVMLPWFIILGIGNIPAISANFSMIIVLIIFSYRKTNILMLSAFYAFLISAITMFSASLTSTILYHIFTEILGGVGRDSVLDSFLATLFYTLMVTAFSVAISYKLGVYLKKQFSLLDKPTMKALSYYLLLGAVIMVSSFFIYIYFSSWLVGTFGYPVVQTLVMGLCFVLLIFSIFAFESSLRNEADSRRKDESFAILRERTNTLEGLSTEARQFRHDHENLMLGFHKHINNNDMESVREYYEKYMVAFCESVAAINKGLDILGKVKSPELQGILSHKIPSAQRAGINVIVDVSDDMKPIENEHLIDVCRITGILLDNAIDACVGVDKPILRLGVLNKGPATLIVIENNFLTAPDLNVIAKEGYTTKEDGQGLGLYTVAGIIEKNPNLGLSTKIKSEYFVQLLSILP